MQTLTEYFEQNKGSYGRKHPGRTILIYYDKASRIQIQVCKSEKEAREYAPRDFSKEIARCLIVNIPKRQCGLEKKVRRKIR